MIGWPMILVKTRNGMWGIKSEGHVYGSLPWCGDWGRVKSRELDGANRIRGMMSPRLGFPFPNAYRKRNCAWGLAASPLICVLFLFRISLSSRSSRSVNLTFFFLISERELNLLYCHLDYIYCLEGDLQIILVVINWEFLLHSFTNNNKILMWL